MVQGLGLRGLGFRIYGSGFRVKGSLQDLLYPREGLGFGSPETSASRRVWLLLATGLEVPAARSQWAFRYVSAYGSGSWTWQAKVGGFGDNGFRGRREELRVQSLGVSRVCWLT